MAHCPNCNAAMGTTEVVCPACGHDFPEESSPRRDGFAYSIFADVALVTSMVAAALGCVAAIYAVILFVLAGQVVNAFGATIAFFVQLGILIVFMRVSDLKN